MARPNILIWSFAESRNMKEAVNAIRSAYDENHDPSITGMIHTDESNNIHWQGPESERVYLTGICRGVAWATCDGSISR